MYFIEFQSIWWLYKDCFSYWFQIARRPPHRGVWRSHRQQHNDLERRHLWSARYTLRGRYLQAHNRIHGRIPQQTPHGSICVQNVPSQRIRRRGHLPRHPAEQMESNLRCVRYSYIYTGNYCITGFCPVGGWFDKCVRYPDPTQVLCIQFLC